MSKCRVCRTVERGECKPYPHEHFDIRIVERTRWDKDGIARSSFALAGGLSKAALVRITERLSSTVTYCGGA